jgi:hypothetical protein
MTSGRRLAVVAAAIAAFSIVAVLGVWLGVPFVLRREVRRTVQRIERDSNGALNITVGGIDIHPLTRRTTLRDVVMRFKAPQGTIALNVASIDVKKWRRLRWSGSEVLREQSLIFHGLSSPQIDRWLGPSQLSLSERVGASILFEAEYNSSYHPEKDNGMAGHVSLSSPKIGALSADFTLNGIDLVKLEQFARDAKTRSARPTVDQEIERRGTELLTSMKIQGAQLLLRDSGLMELVWATTAALKGVSPQEARQNMGAALAAACGKLKAEPWMKTLCDPLASYLDAPRSLRLTVAPSTPCEAARVAALAMTSGPQAVIDRLGLTLTANQD